MSKKRSLHRTSYLRGTGKCVLREKIDQPEKIDLREKKRRWRLQIRMSREVICRPWSTSPISTNTAEMAVAEVVAEEETATEGTAGAEAMEVVEVEA